MGPKKEVKSRLPSSLRRIITPIIAHDAHTACRGFLPLGILMDKVTFFCPITVYVFEVNILGVLRGESMTDFLGLIQLY